MPDLTAVRGLLALWVFAYHANLHLQFAYAGSFIRHGYLGVDGFFILSGLVLAHRHPAPGQRVRDYAGFWWKRLVRLYPTHLAVLILLALLFLAARSAGLRPHQALRADGHELLLQSLLLNGWGFSRGWTWNYPSWSISTEWAGYLVFPGLALAASRLSRRASVAALVVMAACLLAVDLTSASELNLSYHGALLRFFPEFLAGILLARLLVLMARPPPFAIVGAVGVALAVSGLFTADVVTAIGLWCLLWALAAGRQRILIPVPGLSALGAISYPFYMVYAPVEVIFARLWGFARLDPTRAPLLWLAAFFAAVLALAWLMARLVERPALRHLAAGRPNR
jgi:peptidoglycan/LPS O-acetylase OafA/YrhL